VRATLWTRSLRAGALSCTNAIAGTVSALLYGYVFVTHFDNLLPDLSSLSSTTVAGKSISSVPIAFRAVWSLLKETSTVNSAITVRRTISDDDDGFTALGATYGRVVRMSLCLHLAFPPSPPSPPPPNLLV